MTQTLKPGEAIKIWKSGAIQLFGEWRDILVSYCCFNNLSQIWWLKQQLHYLAALKVRSLKIHVDRAWFLLEVVGENPFPGFALGLLEAPPLLGSRPLLHLQNQDLWSACLSLNLVAGGGRYPFQKATFAWWHPILWHHFWLLCLGTSEGHCIFPNPNCPWNMCSLGSISDLLCLYTLGWLIPSGKRYSQQDSHLILPLPPPTSFDLFILQGPWWTTFQAFPLPLLLATPIQASTLLPTICSQPNASY